jgi:hypothetical protein
VKQSLVPPGVYTLKMVSQRTARDKKSIAVTYEIVGGKFNGRRVRGTIERSNK